MDSNYDTSVSYFEHINSQEIEHALKLTWLMLEELKRRFVWLEYLNFFSFFF